MAAQSLYVYGIIGADRAGSRLRPGVGAPPARVRLLPAGRLAAVVSDAPEGLRARRRDLLAHQELLLALADDGPVLPMRFGMVAPDEESLLRELASAEERHLSALKRLDGRVEMNLKAMPVEHSLHSLVSEDVRVRQLREETRRRPGYEANVRLGEAVATGLTRRASEAAAQVLGALDAVADACTRGPEVAGCVLNASFLVPRSRTEHFRRTAEHLAVDHHDRVELRVTGPLPCYSFVDCDPRPHHDLTPTGV
ncbi:GvpL/GvpF family gas vesicle protein [Streptomyces sp. 8N706]|uniref:GvpL/GvpF family gas vesicle protein n=1 Tax=Streptomyces sp. 8N706 TaxID=3457416 RepID=UPI003FD14BC5